MAEDESPNDPSIEDILGDLVRLKDEHKNTTDTFRQRIDAIEKKLQSKPSRNTQSE